MRLPCAISAMPACSDAAWVAEGVRHYYLNNMCFKHCPTQWCAAASCCSANRLQRMNKRGGSREQQIMALAHTDAYRNKAQPPLACWQAMVEVWRQF